MASDTATLAEACELIVDCPHSTPVWTDSGEVVLRNENIKNGRLDQSSPSFTDAKHFADRIRRAVPRPGDLVFTREAPMGEVCMIPNGLRCCLGQRQVLLRPSIRFDNHYLLYAIQSPAVQHQIRWNEGTGSTVSNVRIPILKSLRVPAPSKPEQVRTAAVLKSLDDRIDHNRALAANLEAIARALFKSWFVDFDPVRAKAAGEAPPGLAPDLAALFPVRFVDSELGEIPEGWRAGKIGDVCRNVREGCAASEIGADDFYVGLEHVDRRSLTLWQKGTGSDAISNKSRFEAGDLLFGKLRPYFHKVVIAPCDGICSTDILVIRSKADKERAFTHLALFQDEVIQFVSDASGGTRMPRTNWETLAAFRIVVAPSEVRAAFDDLVRPLCEAATVAVAESRVLARMRDLLLPRLISGKLRVEDAEAALDAA